jgi:hypothetical protein
LLQAKGTLKNISPIRAMTYHVTVETDAGTYAQWLVKDLDVAKSAPLSPQPTSHRMENGPGGPARRFRVRIRSATPDSPAAEAWTSGSLPIPTFRK